ncbi:histidine kinase, partial [Persicitalea sp.]|uniref:histidine kinase n=1 Tax=Persicitalea sp. TaxID=3100273 RepID=UPI003593F2DF
YGLYLGGVALYFSTKTDSLFFLGYWVGGVPKFFTVLNEPVQMLYTALYIRFSMGLLRIKDYDRRLHRFLDVFWKALAVYAVVLIPVSTVVWKSEFEAGLLAFDRVVLLLFTLVMLARIIQKNRSPLLSYFLVGNAFFLTGVVLSTVLSLDLIEIPLFGSLSPINHFQIGVLGEIMCFSFALGYNVRLLERERNKNQKAYIAQLQLNQDFTTNANRELTEKLDERTKEVMAMSEAMQVQKEAHLRSEFEFQLGEMEMQALRAQMNPHFIFNSLNTIRYFVLNNENEKASDYLGKFARLLRMVLQNSRENTIPLSEELEALRLYLEIEARRFGDSFQYQIIVPDDMDTDGIIVPPLLLQPFAENAIWHGLLHSDKPDKQLTIRISEEEDACLFLIEDNGVGRDKARDMKSRSATNKRSFGMQITNKRVELFNKNFSSQIEIDVRDLVSSEGEVVGTAVEIRYQLPE